MEHVTRLRHRTDEEMIYRTRLMELGMRRSIGLRTCSAVTVGIGLSLWSIAALAQTLGGYREYCQQQANGRVVCKQVPGSAGVAGSAPYQRWEDGSAARSSGWATAPRYQPDPLQLGRPNPLYGFSR
jgi:hypothetical protein